MDAHRLINVEIWVYKFPTLQFDGIILTNLCKVYKKQKNEMKQFEKTHKKYLKNDVADARI